MTKTAPKARDSKVSPNNTAPTSREMAKVALNPVPGHASIASCFAEKLFGKVDYLATCEGLQERAMAVRGGDLSSAEDMLTAQAASLNVLFLELTRRSGANLGEYINAAERYMRLALKAQAQCRATLETLAAIKNPPVVIANQANIANGPQQVNNGVGPAAPHAENQQSVPDKLLEANGGEGERLDGGAAGAAIGSRPPLEALRAVHGAAHA